jgi:5'-nucleotidase
MHLLLTNDDGVGAPGLTALARRLRSRAELTVVVPDRERSGVGHGVAFLHDFWVESRPIEGGEAHVISSTPADCVRWALSEWCNAAPDFVVSGMNRGHNCGIHLFYSGTVAAALEAAFCGIPSVAVSMHYDDVARADEAAEIAANVIFETLVPLLRARPAVYNINVPPLEQRREAEPLWTHQSAIPEKEIFQLRRHDGSRRVFRARFGEWTDPEPGSDRWAVANGFVSITPLRRSLCDPAEVQPEPDSPEATV